MEFRTRYEYPSCARIKGNAFVDRSLFGKEENVRKYLPEISAGRPPAIFARQTFDDGVGEIFQVYLRNLRKMRVGIWATIRNLSDLIFVSLYVYVVALFASRVE